MLALLGESRYQIIAPLRFTAYENFIDIEYRNPPRSDCGPVCDGFEELTFKIFMALDSCIDPPAKCATFNYQRRVCGVGEVWSRRPGAPHLKSATSIQLVGNLLELLCYGPDSQGCGLVVNMSLSEGVSTLTSLFGRAEFVEGDINDFVLVKELANRTVITIPGITCEGDCVDVQSTKIMPVYTCPDCVPREYFDKGECVNNPPPRDPVEFPNLGEDYEDPLLNPIILSTYKNTAGYEWNRRTPPPHFVQNYPATGFVLLVTGNVTVTQNPQTKALNLSSSSEPFARPIFSTGSEVGTYLRVNGQRVDSNPASVRRENSSPPGTIFVSSGAYQLRMMDGTVVLDIPATPMGDTPSPSDPNEGGPCPLSGQCKYFIDVNAVVSVGITVLSASITATLKATGQRVTLTREVRLNTSLSFRLTTLGPYCGVPAETSVVSAVATAVAGGLSVVIDRAVDTAITSLVPVGGVLLSQLVETSINTQIRFGQCTP